MSEVIEFPQQNNSQSEWWELLQNATKNAADIEASKSIEVRSTVSKIAIMVPWLLKTQDFSNIVTDLKYLRNPEEYVDQEALTMLKRVENTTANDNRTPVAQAS